MTGPRAIRGSWLAVIAAVFWAVPVLGIPLAIVERAGDPEPVSLLELVVRVITAAVIAAVFGALGYLFWIPARRRSDSHVRELLERRAVQGAGESEPR